MRWTACLVVNPITVGNFAAFFCHIVNGNCLGMGVLKICSNCFEFDGISFLSIDLDIYFRLLITKLSENSACQEDQAIAIFDQNCNYWLSCRALLNKKDVSSKSAP